MNTVRCEQICKGLLERLLNIKIEKLEFPKLQKSIAPHYESKGVRLDVYIKDSTRATKQNQTFRGDYMAWGLAEQDAEKRGYKAGVADGISQGISQGTEQKAIETAKNFISMGIPFEQIAQGTGLPLETIEQIAKDNMLA